jgi:hypothetical protein
LEFSGVDPEPGNLDSTQIVASLDEMACPLSLKKRAGMAVSKINEESKVCPL